MLDYTVTMTPDNKYLIKLEVSGLDEEILFKDKINFAVFKEDSQIYLEVDTVIKWHQKQFEITHDKLHSNFVVALERLKRKILSGNFQLKKRKHFNKNPNGN